MRQLLKHLSPFAPDDSGACSVLYEAGGITVICDAGGCTGNVCGFDEPRWHEKKSALLSAGLRDMDAILGRDRLLIRKLAEITKQIPAAFTAIVGTPVPAVIATDFRALGRMAEEQTGLPCLTLDTDGTKYYDTGASLAYLQLMQRFATERLPVRAGKCGVLGATPLDTGLTGAGALIQAVQALGYEEAVCFGLDSGLADIRRASECAHLLVIAPSGLKAAEYLHRTFGTPYSVGYPLLPVAVKERAEALSGKRVLIVHEQFAADALSECITDCEVECGTWFLHDPRFETGCDYEFTDEAQFREVVNTVDTVIADAALRRAAFGFTGEWIDFPHPAVSGFRT